MNTEEVILSLFGMKCSLVGGKVKVLDTFSKPFSLLEQNIELEADHEYTRLWEERLQCHIDAMRTDLPTLYEEWLNGVSTNKEGTKKMLGIEVSGSPVFGIIQGNIVDGELKKRYKVKHHTEINK